MVDAEGNNNNGHNEIFVFYFGTQVSQVYHESSANTPHKVVVESYFLAKQILHALTTNVRRVYILIYYRYVYINLRSLCMRRMRVISVNSGKLLQIYWHDDTETPTINNMEVSNIWCKRIHEIQTWNAGENFRTQRRRRNGERWQ